MLQQNFDTYDDLANPLIVALIVLPSSLPPAVLPRLSTSEGLPLRPLIAPIFSLGATFELQPLMSAMSHQFPVCFPFSLSLSLSLSFPSHFALSRTHPCWMGRTEACLIHPCTPLLFPQANLPVIRPTTSTLMCFIIYTLHRTRFTPSVTVAALYLLKIQTTNTSTHHPALHLSNLRPPSPKISPTPVHPLEPGHCSCCPSSFPIPLHR